MDGSDEKKRRGFYSVDRNDLKMVCLMSKIELANWMGFLKIDENKLFGSLLLNLLVNLSFTL